MAVTPIVQGQSRTEKNPIPPPHYRTESYTSTTSPTIATHEQPPAAGNDLIDFGQDEDNVPSHIPADLHAAQTLNNGQQQKDLEKTLRETSTERKTQGDSLIDFHQDLKKDLPSLEGQGGALRRHDTDTSSLDEFVDAEG